MNGSLELCDPDHIQPESIEYHTADGVMVKTMAIKHKDVMVPQHSHEHDHLTVIAAGSVRAWCDDELLGDFFAPASLEIPAGTKHRFLSLEPNTMLMCIHNISRTGQVQIRDEHQLGRHKGRIFTVMEAN